MCLGPILFAIRDGAIRSYYITAYRLLLCGIVLPVTLLLLAASWGRGKNPPRMMAASVITVPLALYVLMLATTFRSSPWWEALLGLLTVMLVPCAFAHELLRGTAVRAYYDHGTH